MDYNWGTSTWWLTHSPSVVATLYCWLCCPAWSQSLLRSQFPPSRCSPTSGARWLSLRIWWRSVMRLQLVTMAGIGLSRMASSTKAGSLSCPRHMSSRMCSNWHILAPMRGSRRCCSDFALNFTSNTTAASSTTSFEHVQRASVTRLKLCTRRVSCSRFQCPLVSRPTSLWTLWRRCTKFMARASFSPSSIDSRSTPISFPWAIRTRHLLSPVPSSMTLFDFTASLTPSSATVIQFSPDMYGRIYFASWVSNYVWVWLSTLKRTVNRRQWTRRLLCTFGASPVITPMIGWIGFLGRSIAITPPTTPPYALCCLLLSTAALLQSSCRMPWGLSGRMLWMPCSPTMMSFSLRCAPSCCRRRSTHVASTTPNTGRLNF